jgi:hypothetical protein
MLHNKEQFVQGIINELKKSREQPKKNFVKAELKKRSKYLQAKKEKYQEMYASDVMTMTELKEKVSYINKELDDLTEQLGRYDSADTIKKVNIENICNYNEEIEDFLTLRTVTNGDLRKIISLITVDREGEIKIFLRNLSDLTIA